MPMEKLTHLLLADPRAVIESGVVIPCSLRDLLAVALDDHTCTFRNEARCASPGAAGAPLRMAQLRNDH
jgi:hypothetical protein